jgi:excisionase family DNA binding protein
MTVTALENLLTLAETAKLLRISRGKLHALVRAGELKAVKFGRRTLFRAASVAEFVDAHEKRATPARALALIGEKP